MRFKLFEGFLKPSVEPSGDPLGDHYRIQGLCRVSGTLGKAPITLSKGFAECNTWQRALGSDFVGSDFIGLLSSTRQRFCRVPKTLGKKKHSAKYKSEKSKKRNRKKNLLGEACTAN
jgi:hypothetical protein